jgi:hypothetical protein
MDIYHFSKGNIDRAFYENTFLFQKKWKYKLPYSSGGGVPSYKTELYMAKHIFFKSVSLGFSIEDIVKQIYEINGKEFLDAFCSVLEKQKKEKTNEFNKKICRNIA